MKKKNYLLASFLLMNLLLSCKDEINEKDDVGSVKSEAAKGLNLRPLFSEHHVIPISEASNIAIKATELFEDESTRANNFNPRVIESVGVYGWTNSSLRSANASEDTLIYVFNFADNRGFAIVAADDRIPTQILAYVDEGSLENALELMQDYVESSIDNFEQTKDSLLAMAEVYSFEVDEKVTETRASYYTGTACYYLSESIVGPLLKVTWGQTYPYNMYVDKSCTNEGGNGGKAPVGCVATATAQIMSYWKYPSILNQLVLNWNNICSSSEIEYFNKDNIARLMIEIGSEVNMDYECDGSGAKTSEAYNFFGRIGYNKSFSKLFNSSDAKSAIDSSRPLLVDGYREKKTSGILLWKSTHYKHGHTWVMDGYLIIHYKQENYRINKRTGKYSSTISFVDETYFHNNWGYEGDGNGYFAAGCFNMQDAYRYDNSSYSELRDYRYENYMYCVYR